MNRRVFKDATHESEKKTRTRTRRATTSIEARPQARSPQTNAILIFENYLISLFSPSRSGAEPCTTTEGSIVSVCSTQVFVS